MEVASASFLLGGRRAQDLRPASSIGGGGGAGGIHPPSLHSGIHPYTNTQSRWSDMSIDAMSIDAQLLVRFFLTFFFCPTMRQHEPAVLMSVSSASSSACADVGGTAAVLMCMSLCRPPLLRLPLCLTSYSLFFTRYAYMCTVQL